MDLPEIRAVATKIAADLGIPPPTIKLRRKVHLASGKKIPGGSQVFLNAALTKRRPDFVYQLVYVLLARLAGKTRTPLYKQVQQQLHEAIAGLRREGELSRYRHQPCGEHVNLQEVFDAVVEKYFGVLGAFDFEGLKLCWTARRTYRQMGSYDPQEHSIRISKTMDDPTIPPFVIEYVMYHELLHAVLGLPRVNKRVVMHSRRFKELETLYPRYQEANQILDEIALQQRLESLLGRKNKCAGTAA
jgi:hypothetical protein